MEHVFIVSGPMSVDKTTIMNAVIGRPECGLGRIITTTTRPPHPHEVEGEDYYFVSDTDFEEGIRE